MWTIVFALAILIACSNIFQLSNAQRRNSPCPDVFQYENQRGANGAETWWYGRITITNDVELHGIWIQIKFDKEVDSLGNWFGEATSVDNVEFTIRNPEYVLTPDQPASVRFYVKYKNRQSKPNVLNIRLNGKMICNAVTLVENKLHISKVKTTERPIVPLNPEGNNAYVSVTETNENGNSARPDWNEGNQPQSQKGEDSYNNGNKQNIDYNAGTNDNQNIQTTSSTETTLSYTNTGNREQQARPSSTPNYQNSQHHSGYENSQQSVGFKGTTASGFDSTGNDRINSGYQQTLQNQNQASNYDFASEQSQNTSQNRVSALNSGDNRNKQTTGNPESTTTFKSTTSRYQNYDSDFFSSDFSPTKVPLRPLSSAGENDEISGDGCGTVKSKPRPLITNGELTSEGEWPWHAALYHAKGIDWTYICGASLLTKKHLITAAHCVTRPQTLKNVDPENLLVYLGKTNLRNFGTPGIQDRAIQSFAVHPNYDPKSFGNDIAILTLAKEVEITDWVRTLCLWEGSDDQDLIENQHGSVVGWGLNENGLLSQNLLQAKMPVVKTVTCLYSNPEFFGRFTSEKTFCAGFRNGTSVCNGDSGGGMVFKKPGSNVWQLRGLVSISIARQGEAVCDTNHYVVFTDAAKYIPWIKEQLR